MTLFSRPAKYTFLKIQRCWASLAISSHERPWGCTKDSTPSSCKLLHRSRLPTSEGTSSSLHHLPMKQNWILTPSWVTSASSHALSCVGWYINGFHWSTSEGSWKECHIDRGRPFLQVCSLYSLPPPIHNLLSGSRIFQWHRTSPWTSRIHCFWPRPRVHRHCVEELIQVLWCGTEDEHCISATNRWSVRGCQ
jgi:hypothetical protein